jgi:endo-1,4-beta-D-glucanase Y
MATGASRPNSASDSDLWIAYDLIEAGRLWKDLHYANTGRRLAALIAHREVADLPGFGPALLPGAGRLQRLQRFWVLNPSYTRSFSSTASPKSIPKAHGPMSPGVPS